MKRVNGPTAATVLILMTLISAFSANAAAVKAKKRSTQSFASFVTALLANGQNNHIRPNIAPFLSLPPKAPSKAYIVDNLPREQDRRPEKIFNLVLDSDGKPMSVVLIEGYTSETDSASHYFKAGLDGMLLSAFKIVGKRRGSKAVRGSGVKEDLDVASPDVQKAFKKELDFWLSGKFRKYWKPKSVP